MGENMAQFLFTISLDVPPYGEIFFQAKYIESYYWCNVYGKDPDEIDVIRAYDKDGEDIPLDDRNIEVKWDDVLNMVECQYHKRLERSNDHDVIIYENPMKLL
jgi:hypothetical protein